MLNFEKNGYKSNSRTRNIGLLSSKKRTISKNEKARNTSNLYIIYDNPNEELIQEGLVPEERQSDNTELSPIALEENTKTSSLEIEEYQHGVTKSPTQEVEEFRHG